MVTRIGLVVKIGCFLLEKVDEKESRRQKRAFYASKWWRE